MITVIIKIFVYIKRRINEYQDWNPMKEEAEKIY
jgi:hypothetical protein